MEKYGTFQAEYIKDLWAIKRYEEGVTERK